MFARHRSIAWFLILVLAFQITPLALAQETQLLAVSSDSAAPADEVPGLLEWVGRFIPGVAKGFVMAPVRAVEFALGFLADPGGSIASAAQAIGGAVTGFLADPAGAVGQAVTFARTHPGEVGELVGDNLFWAVATAGAGAGWRHIRAVRKPPVVNVADDASLAFARQARDGAAAGSDGLILGEPSVQWVPGRDGGTVLAASGPLGLDDVQRTLYRASAEKAAMDGRHRSLLAAFARSDDVADAGAIARLANSADENARALHALAARLKASGDLDLARLATAEARDFRELWHRITGVPPREIWWE
jgi:hypothetical protein